MMWPQPVSSVAVVLVVAAAVVWDLKSRRVPNALTLGGAAAAIVVAGFTQGWPGVLRSGAGWVTGAALFFPLFALGGMGAGDVKLLAALGTWTGAAQVLWVALFAAIAGGVLAILVSLYSNHARQLFSNIRLLLTHWSVVGIRPVDALTLDHGRGPRLPYAVPIALGLLWALWVQ